MRLLACLAAVAAIALAACGPSDDDEGGCKDKLFAGDLVITEVFADYAAPDGGTGADEGKEWFEIYNASDRPVELEGVTITHGRIAGSTSAPKKHSMGTITIAPGAYLTLGNSTKDLLPPYIDYGYSNSLGDMFNTGGGKIELSCGATVIDSATYDGVKAGRSRQLTAAQPPDYTLNDDLANWCESTTTEFEPKNFGTPGQENDCRPALVGQCSDGNGVRATVPPAVGDLVITEVMPRPKTLSATVAQWFEVRAMKDVDLNGVGLDRANDNNIKPEVLSSPDCIRLSAGSYAVFARSADPTMNGGLTTTGKFAFSLNPTMNPDVQLVYGDEIIDRVTWMTSTTGASLQLDPAATDAAANDDISNWCNGAAQYEPNGNLGTPGAANRTCPTAVGPGQCLDNGTPRAIVKPAAGQVVISELLPNAAGTGTDAAQEWFELANIGPTAFDLNGLGVKGGAATVNVVTSVNCKSVPANGFALFAHGDDPATNGGLPAVDAIFTFSLATTLSVLDGATVLDAVTLVNPQPADGVSRQVRPGSLTTTGNDDPANFCDSPKDANHQYGPLLNYGTPKAANTCM